VARVSGFPISCHVAAEIAGRWNELLSSRFDALAGPERQSMESEGAAGLWLFAVLGGPAILAVALIYGGRTGVGLRR
jgi:hypothetical protein